MWHISITTSVKKITVLSVHKKLIQKFYSNELLVSTQITCNIHFTLMKNFIIIPKWDSIIRKKLIMYLIHLMKKVGIFPWYFQNDIPLKFPLPMVHRAFHVLASHSKGISICIQKGHWSKVNQIFLPCWEYIKEEERTGWIQLRD